MSQWFPLAPAPRTTRGAYEFVATAAQRADSGLMAEVQVINGTVRWGNQVVLSSQDARQRSGQAIARDTQVAPADAANALLELHALVEESLRAHTHAPSGWPPPLSFRHTPPPLPFPTEVLPAWLRDYTIGVGEETQTPVDLAAMLSLAMLALVNQRYALLEVKSGYTEPLGLYVLVAMESGERKSAVYNKMADPVYEYEAQLRERLGPEIAALQAQRRILEKRLDKAVNTAAGTDATDDDRAQASLLAKEVQAAPAPVDSVLVIQDSTPEAMVRELAEQGGCMAILDSEGGLLDTIMGARYADVPNLDPILKAHAGDPIRSARVSRARVNIDAPALTIGIAPQPEVLRGLGTTPGTKKRGVLARFLYSQPHSLKGSRMLRPPSVPHSVLLLYRQHMRTMLVAGEALVPGTPLVRTTMSMELAALELWYEFSEWLEPQLPRDAHLGGTNGWAEKLAGQVARIAGNFHLADGHDPRAQALCPVSFDAMQRACYLGEVYLLPHALAALHAMGVDPAIEEAEAIYRWYERKGVEAFSVREVCDDLRYRFNRPADLDPAISILLEYGYIRAESTVDRKGPGRKPSPRFFVNPEKPTLYTLNTKGTDAPEGIRFPYAPNSQNLYSRKYGELPHDAIIDAF